MIINNKNIRLAGITGSVLLSGFVLTSEAQAADGFGINIQSAYFFGMANAGAGAGGDISSMYWNSAATAVSPGFTSSSNAAGQWVTLDQHATGGAFTQLGYSNSADSGTDAFISSSFDTYQINDRLWIGLALNAPFGLITKPDHFWAGSPFASTERDFTFEANPTIAYKITPTVTIGAGIQVLYDQQRLSQGPGAPIVVGGNLVGFAPGSAFRGTDWGVGGTAGVLWDVVPGTTVGAGYRSAVSVDPSGSFQGFASRIPATALSPIYTSANAPQTLPDLVTGSIRHTVFPGFTVAGTLQWENWSRFGNVPITSPLGTLNVVNFNYRDAWLLSLGGEYQYSSSVTLRAGVEYDISPITDFVRDVGLPDANSVLVTIGGSYQYSDRIRLDLAYGHVFFDNAPWCIGDPTTTGTTHCVGGSQEVLVRGQTSDSADVVVVGLKYSLAPQAPLK